MRIILSTVAALVLAGCGGGRPAVPPSDVAVTDTSPPEVKLAALDRAGYGATLSDKPLMPLPLTVTRAQVQRYAAALNRLAQHCSDSRERLGDMVVSAQQQSLTRWHVFHDLLTYAENAAASVEGTGGRRPCARVFTALVLSEAH